MTLNNSAIVKQYCYMINNNEYGASPSVMVWQIFLLPSFFFPDEDNINCKNQLAFLVKNKLQKQTHPCFQCCDWGES